MTITRPDLAPSVDRTEARRILLAELDRHVQAGREVPCLTWRDAGWTSEDDAEQALAARLCPACPAVGACRAYGSAWPKEAGVLGAVLEHERRAGLARPSTDRKVA